MRLRVVYEEVHTKAPGLHIFDCIVYTSLEKLLLSLIINSLEILQTTYYAMTPSLILIVWCNGGSS